MKAEQFIKDYTDKCSNEMDFEKNGERTHVCAPWLSPERALCAVDIAREEMIEKACDAFCKVRCKGNPPRSNCTSFGTCKEYDDFRKTIKEEQV